MDCLFCKIIEGKIPAKKIYEDKEILAFYDIEPVAPVHIIIIPKEHIKSLEELNEENAYITAKILLVASKLAKELNLKNGYRIVNNCGKEGGQTVEHLHFHLLGGRKFFWPAG